MDMSQSPDGPYATTNLTPPQQQPPDNDSVDDDIAREPSESLTVSRWIVISVAFLHLGFLVYYFGYVMSYIKFQDEFTGWVSPPPPGIYRVAEWYDWQWFFVICVTPQFLAPFACLWTMNKVYSQIRADVSRGLIALLLVSTGVALAGFIFMYLSSNSTWFPFNIANSDDYCCKFFGSVASSGRCRNVGECPDASSATVSIAVNIPFVQLFAGSGISIAFLGVEFFVVYMSRTYARTLINGASIDPGYANYMRAVKRVPYWSKILLNFILIVYTVFIFCYLWLGPLALDLRYSHQYPAVGPVGIQSARDSLTVSGLVVAATVLLVPALSLLSVYVTGRPVLGYMIVACLIALTCLHSFSFMTVVYARSYANIPGQPNNPANSRFYCCPPDIYMNPASQCDNTVNCVLPFSQHPGITTVPTLPSDLDYNTPHSMIFGFLIGFIGLDIVIALLVLSTSMLSAVSLRTQSMTDYISTFISTPMTFQSMSHPSQSLPQSPPLPNDVRRRPNGGSEKPLFSSTGPKPTKDE